MCKTSISIASFWFILNLFTSSFFAEAQDSTYKVTIASPNAASLGKYGDIPVSYHTGVPQISIPVYTVKAGPLELPVGLSYHASGLKVQEAASWVGAGWTLNAGGVIARTVKGGPDDRGYASSNYSKGHYSDYGYNSYLIGGAGALDDIHFARGGRDGEPDLYFFNFGSYSGKFYFNDDREAVLIPEADFKIVADYNASDGGFRGFTITSDDGVQYFFGKTGNTGTVQPIEITNPTTLQNGPASTSLATSAWYLNKIVSADGKFTISFSYVQENYSFYALSMFPLLVTDPSSKKEYNLIKNFVLGVRLSQISFPNGTVTFNASPVARLDLSAYANQTMYDQANTNAKSLGEIQISDGNGFCKKFTLSYSYFHDNNVLTGELATTAYSNNNIQSDAKRLRLDSLKEVSCDNSIKLPACRFNYFSEQVPRLLSFGIDHWGFYNGVNYNQTLIPSYTENNGTTVIPFAGANRDPAWPAMRGGALKKITYPTGGFTELDFEPHSTYMSYTENQWSSVLGMSLGFDQSIGPITSYLTANANPYKVDLANTSVHSASLKIYNNATNALVQDLGANPNSTQQYNFSLASGTYYRLELRLVTGGNPNASGTGVNVSLTQWTPVTIVQNQTVGGLRIKAITSNDGITAVNNITSYTYANGTQSTGVLYSRPVYVQTIRNNNYALVEPYCSPNGCASCFNGAMYYRSPSSVMPMATTQGSHIGYNEVKVTKTGNGHSSYSYYGSPTWDGINADVVTRYINTSVCNSTTPNFPAAPLPFEFMRGELKYERHYNQSGQLLKEDFLTPSYVANPETTPGYIVAELSSQGLPSPLFLVGTEYELQTAKKAKVVVVSKNYDPANSGTNTVTNTTYFGSAFHSQPTRSIVSTSTGDSLITNLKYVADFRIAACDALSTGLSAYTTAINNALIYLNSNLNSCSPQVAGTNNCRKVVYLQYRTSKCNARIAYITTRRNNFTNPSNQFDINHLSAKNSAGAELKPILELQDVYQNHIIEQSQWKNNKLLGASFTRYDYVSNPAGRVYPNKTQVLPVLTPGITFTSAAVSGSSIIKDSRYKNETFVKFDNGQLVEIIGKSGVSDAYVWGHNNSFPVVKSQGVSYAVLKAAYDAVSGNLTNIRSQPSLATAILSTYTYSPLVGMTSATGPDEKPIIYEYDGLGRLWRNRDFNNHIIKQLDYQYKTYAGTVYFNDPQSSFFTRNNCGANYTGSQVTYSVPEFTYLSTVSKSAANLLATNDIGVNGQAYANASGTCTYTGPPVTIQGYNSLGSSLQVRFTNTSTGAMFDLFVNSNTFSPYNLGTVPSGGYTIQFFVGTPVNGTYKVNTLLQYGMYGATFSNISVNATTTVARY